MAFGGDETVTTTNKTEGGSESKTVTRPMQHEYYKQLLGQANNLYKKGLPGYYGGATVAGFNPDQMDSMNMATNWTTGGAQDMMHNQNNRYQQMMSGQNNMGSAYGGLEGGFNNNLGQMMTGQVNLGEGSPYQNMANTFQDQAMENAQDMMGQLRSTQVMSGQAGGSTRGDLMNNQVIDQANQSVQQNMAGMYNNAYNQAQSAQQFGIGQYGGAQQGSMNNAAQTQMSALGQYGSIMNQPLEMSKHLYNRVGLPQQQQNQAQMDDLKARYDYKSSAPWQNLAQFGNFIQGNMGGINTGSSSSSGSSTTTQT